ncbi:hypothetical protein TWF730_002505 [Orbilia blumenaviensis]|uniref:Protein kinase domain-containing protein n=1 Tax=Orbilia blumenaviensis TaxID=1796055 RepID=A0AAV9UA89_9PEZI
MDISSEIFDTLLSPVAAYILPTPLSNEGQAETWYDSVINPKNLPDSVGILNTTFTWDIDGIDVDGRKFFVVPSFMRGSLPLRVDLHLPPHGALSPAMRKIFHVDRLMIPDKVPAMSLEISKHVVRALDYWSKGIVDFETQYRNLPFGSRIMIDNLAPNPRHMGVYLVPVYDIEQQWHSQKTLQGMWNLPVEDWPAVIDLGELQLQRQPHEAISLVTIPSRHAADKVFVFKSLCRDINYLYHELKMLLTIKPHGNIMSRPLYIVTKKCNFGGKVGICGFIVKFYPDGTLRDILRRSNPVRDRITMRDRFRWAKDVCSALLHVKASLAGYYPDLKPDNLIMRRNDQDGLMHVALIDFEQRGGWFSWSPPEIYYLEYLEVLASSRNISSALRQQYATLLYKAFPSWKPMTKTIRYKDNPAVSFQGYSCAWENLTLSERESAQVFMLGKILWCIFESAASINCHMGVDFLREEINDDQQLFPEFRKSPEAIKELINACTAGAPEWNGRYRCIVRQENKIRAITGKNTESNLREDPPDKQQLVVQAWWMKEVEEAKDFFNYRVSLSMGKSKDNGDKDEHELRETINASVRRPTMNAVLAKLEEIELQIDSV